MRFIYITNKDRSGSNMVKIQNGSHKHRS